MQQQEKQDPKSLGREEKTIKEVILKLEDQNKVIIIKGMKK